MSEVVLERLAEEIKTEHAAATAADGSSLQHVKRCGERLLWAKRHLVTHGRWISFVIDWCDLSIRLAQLYMQVARGWPQLEQKRNDVTHLSLREALSLLRKPGTRPTSPVPRIQWKELNPDERREVRRIAVEMDVFRYTSRTFNERPDSSGFDIVAGCGGAPVYWDVVGGNPNDACPVFRYTRGEVRQKVEAFVDGGPRSVVSDLAVDVARRRLAGDRTLSPPWLPHDDLATVTLSPKTQEQCAVLAPHFNAKTLDEVVAQAVDFAHFHYATQLDDDVETVWPEAVAR